jgi:hypothetical protein
MAFSSLFRKTVQDILAQVEKIMPTGIMYPGRHLKEETAFGIAAIWAGQ